MPSPTELYDEYAGKILRLARFCTKRFHIDFDDALSAVHVGFMRAVETYDPKKNVDFLTWIRWKARAQCSGDIRSNYRHTGRSVGLEMDRFACMDVGTFEIPESLSANARQVLSLLFDETPEDIETAIQTVKHRKGIKSAIRTFLVNAGWTVRQVSAAFDEITRSLR